MKYLENSMMRVRSDRKNDKSYINQITSLFPDNYNQDLVNLCYKYSIKFQSLDKKTTKSNLETLKNY